VREWSVSVRHSLLALLQHRPRCGYQLRQAFEEQTGGAWQLNIGQVYTTLSRLERDGLVTEVGEGEASQRPYALTDTGQRELAAWLTAPVQRKELPRDELVIKLALVLEKADDSFRETVQAQRVETIRHLQRLTQRKRAGVTSRHEQLVIDAHIFQLEAELRWLDYLEADSESPPAPDHVTGMPMASVEEV
jgi:DNA-binding PadR family transcriptional regulator